MNESVTNSYKPTSVKQRLGILLVGFLGNHIIVNLFDNVLYPFVIWQKGPIIGGFIMIMASLLICLLTFWFYDWAKQDWLGIESMKEVKDATKNRFMAWALKQSDPVLFVALSIWTDPFITTVVMRKGSWQFDGLSKRDWKIFFGSLLVGNLEWILMLSGGIWILQNKVWPWLQPILNSMFGWT